MENTEKKGLSKYMTGQTAELMRSEIHFADYNPRKITPENHKTLKKGIKKFGMVGGLVVNKRTGNTLVSGHQRLTAMDELQKYDPDTKKKDYKLRCEVVDIDEKEEKELLILLNNPNAQGEWDGERMKDILPEIDYAAAGLSDEDVAMFSLCSDEYTEVYEAYNQMYDDFCNIPDLGEELGLITPPTAAQALAKPKRDGHIYERKKQISEETDKKNEKASAFIMIRFGGLAECAEFLSMFDYPSTTQVIDGDDFLQRMEM